MNLDELLASFSRAISETVSGPLLRVEDYLPVNQKRSKAAKAGGRQLVGAFLYWLARNDQLSERGRERIGAEGATKSLQELQAALQLRFTDVIEAVDVIDAVQPFCRAYLPAATGSYADDFHVLFVEQTPVKSYLDVLLTPEDLERLVAQVNERLAAFEQGRPDWQAGLEMCGPSPGATGRRNKSPGANDEKGS